MVTVVIPSFDRPAMLRTALKSIAQQTALDQIERVVISECVPESETANLCHEFPSLPIHYVLRDRVLKPLDHTQLLFDEALELGSELVAVLHDDDWWSPTHVSAGVAQLRQHPDALAYWAASFMVHGERSWVFECWNVSTWVAAAYPPLDTVVKMDLKTAALTCVTSGPASYSSLIGRPAALANACQVIAQIGNLFDHDRLLYLELAQSGPLLVGLTPQVYIRHHPARDQNTMGEDNAARYIAESTHLVLDFCAREGIDVKAELTWRCESCPVSGAGPAWFSSTIDPRAKPVLLERDALPDAVRAIIAPPPPPPPVSVPPPPPRDPLIKTLARWICPGGVWEIARYLRHTRAARGLNGTGSAQ